MKPPAVVFSTEGLAETPTVQSLPYLLWNREVKGIVKQITLKFPEV